MERLRIALLLVLIKDYVTSPALATENLNVKTVDHV